MEEKKGASKRRREISETPPGAEEEQEEREEHPVRKKRTADPRNKGRPQKRHNPMVLSDEEEGEPEDHPRGLVKPQNRPTRRAVSTRDKGSVLAKKSTSIVGSDSEDMSAAKEYQDGSREEGEYSSVGSLVRGLLKISQKKSKAVSTVESDQDVQPSDEGRTGANNPSPRSSPDSDDIIYDQFYTEEDERKVQENGPRTPNTLWRIHHPKRKRCGERSGHYFMV